MHDYSAKEQRGSQSDQIGDAQQGFAFEIFTQVLNNYDLLWVNLVWNNYYRTDRLPGCSIIGSFWWKSLLSLV